MTIVQTKKEKKTHNKWMNINKFRVAKRNEDNGLFWVLCAFRWIVVNKLLDYGFKISGNITFLPSTAHRHQQRDRCACSWLQCKQNMGMFNGWNCDVCNNNRRVYLNGYKAEMELNFIDIELNRKHYTRKRNFHRKMEYTSINGTIRRILLAQE